MTLYALQISPEAKSAYFKDVLHVAAQELSLVIGERASHLIQIGGLSFLELEADEQELPRLLECSFAQGIYRKEGDALFPVDLEAQWRLHEDFVFGSKFRGKTNERLTQLLINIGLANIEQGPREAIKLLDPMAGRATTLLWALRYGIQAYGVEQDAKALSDVTLHLKKWTKLHRQKHQLSEGFIGKANRKDDGRFIDFTAAERTMRLVIGDTQNAAQLFKKDKFDLMVSDLPYGVQHFTTEGTRNPLAVIEQSIPGWASCLKPNGAIVLAFNQYMPKRVALVAAFEAQGFNALPFSSAHRMSESIVRDVVVFKKSLK